MKKVVVETECGEETQFYVEQDVSTITVDGEEWVKKTDNNKGPSAIDLEGATNFTELAKRLEKLQAFEPQWQIGVSCDEDKGIIEIQTCGDTIWKHIK